ncbi:MAG TPA: glycoside hydrolase family 38 C-terminal domain-containing protein [Anaerolineae bacterium]
MNQNPMRLFFISHTHWDREWYEPFQVFRLRLVHTIDKLLDILAREPDYKFYMLDGQTIVLEDYFEVRPEREPELRAHIASGRVLVGPWYILPDEFLVSGEAIIRNFLRGLRIAESFGEAGVMRVGYIPDPFGHISQIPQILRGFGVETAVFRRGLADEPVELEWVGADGTRIFTIYLREGYDNAAWLVRTPDEFVAGVERLRDALAPYQRTPDILLMNGTDHMEPWEDLPALIDYAREKIPNTEILHSTLPQYIARVNQDLGVDRALPQIIGELRNPKRHHLLPGVVSTRMWIKQRNAQAQVLLEKWVEPFVAFAHSGTHDAAPAQAAVHLAWKYLLQNQPHDSICGCSVDQVHREMAPRFDAVMQIAGATLGGAQEMLVGQIETTNAQGRDAIVVFNPNQGPLTDVARVENLPSDGNYAVVDELGQAVAQCRDAESGQVVFVAPDVPGYGYRTFYLQPALTSVTESASNTRKLENDFYRLEPNWDSGTLTLFDKQTGLRFRNINQFVDGADCGDLYNYSAPSHDLVIDAPVSVPQIEIVERNAVRQVMRITAHYRVPVGLTRDRSSRAQESVDLPIVTTITLHSHIRRIEFHVEVENHARDHRLRVHFGTPIRTTESFADQAFDIVTRSTNLPGETTDWIEQPVGTLPMQKFMFVREENNGLMLATRGLPEYQVLADVEGVTLACTLLRCVEWLSRDDFASRRGQAGPELNTPGAQEQGAHSFDYALIPFARSELPDAIAVAHAFNAPLRAARTGPHSGTLPAVQSFVRVEPQEFILTTVKLPEKGDGLIVRGYNIGDALIDAEIRLYRPFTNATLVNLNESEIAPLDLKESRVVQFAAKPREIVTIKFV